MKRWKLMKAMTPTILLKSSRLRQLIRLRDTLVTYEEYELNNTMTKDLEEPWLDNRDHKWYDELVDGKLKEETLMHKAEFKESWGDATLGVMKFCAWLKSSFKNFHELDYNVLVNLEECWWKVNSHEVAPFTRWENYDRDRMQTPKLKELVTLILILTVSLVVTME
ncbi:hypothetical protein Tco_1296248 [Tanacetum coccineum]